MGGGGLRIHNRVMNKKKMKMGRESRLKQKYQIIIIITHSMAQQPLKSFDRPLVRVSLSDSILVTLIFY